MLLAFALQVVVFSIGPFFCAALGPRHQAMAYYVYMGIVLFIASFAGALYAFPLADGITVSGGNLAYGAFVMSTVLLVIVQRNVNVLRVSAVMVICVDIFKALYYTSVVAALKAPSAVNPFNTDVRVFTVSIEVLIIGGTLIILELVILFLLFERIKAWVTALPVLAILYTFCFFGVIVLDGIIFPVVAFRDSPVLSTLVAGGLGGKAVVGAAFSPVILLFLVVFWRRLERFAHQPLALRELLQLPSESLVERAQESEQKYRMLVETAHDLIWAVDVSGRITFMNQASRRIYGREPEEMIGRLYTDFVPPEQVGPNRMSLITASRNSDRVRDFENWVLHKDGHRVLLNANAIVQRDSKGHVIGSTGTSQDITQRKWAETQLRMSEARYRQLFENSPIAKSEQDFSGMKAYLDGLTEAGVTDIQAYLETHPASVDACLTRVKILMLNQAAIDVYRMPSRNELVMHFSEFLTTPDPAAYQMHARSMAAIAAGRAYFEGEFINKRATGESFNLLVRWVVLPGSETSYEHVLLTGIDVTPLKRAQADALAALERERTARIQAEALRKTAETLVRTTAIDQSLTQAAHLLHDLIQFDALSIQFVEQNNLRVVVQQTPRTALVSESAGAIDPQRPILTDYTVVPLLRDALATGRLIRKADVPSPPTVPPAGPALTRSLGLDEGLCDWIAVPLIARNITVGLLSIGLIERSLSEADVETVTAFGAQIALAIDSARVNSDLEKSYEQLQAAQESMIQAARLSAIGELAAGIAHQINNPLMTVIADSYLILKHVGPESPERESAEAVNRAAHKAGQIVQRLLDFARAVPSTMEPTDINQSVELAVSLVRPQIAPNVAELRMMLAPALPLIRGSNDHLQDIWMNLLLNARDAVRQVDKPQISIRTEADVDRNAIRITVADNGKGIPAADLPHIFEPFFTTKQQGTGLGLAVVMEIVRRHGGALTVESTPELGTTFTVIFPVR
jgi:PAS domain S-box-containing protein